ncbi:hypothetical protein LEP1GSC021_2913 [Leptospira noguchii str. 1993005606]|uniref:Uncharacterized protein n=3 Tax=Leptospira noguchii TaxID=28182 RepID=M6YCB9_9LEPT|nr:hypothetical protein LEP1GSC072_4108 [Leptospira noguchii str. Bonito]EMN01680.1 hypothetical protein LEP1GSC035_0233 [Leptospira noguchii str. 2007001578]EMO27355.1 hypothetical protein LEP1GSC170_6290 [Leptospira interrogans serovar Bataviae str. HAI135]EMO39011.1 hypothetical protein LEP1GSC186_3641 [Leptospira noguchii serovar Autumnalis str. ZUN142]EMO87299.1 hypothetical protein LEP1GSC024_0685 [Leptospira noguchii str. 2001034031]EPE81934.1 hypothetical protein LEP1GSC021_2913 [Lepto
MLISTFNNSNEFSKLQFYAGIDFKILTFGFCKKPFYPYLNFILNVY